MTKPLSVQLYTIRDALAVDAVGSIGRLASVGFDAVEGFALVDLADRYAEALQPSGLTMPSCHASLMGADLDAVLAAAARLGVATVIEPWVDP